MLYYFSLETSCHPVCTIMDHSRSPLSENIIRRVVEEEYLDKSFVRDVIVSEDDSSDSSLFGDDTDHDPDYDPTVDLDQAGPSNQLPIRPRQQPVFVHSDSSDEETSPSFQLRPMPIELGLEMSSLIVQMKTRRWNWMGCR
ncbi:hypothetical protein J6590_001814 [Homalodisca vitripennis]|nr:hypothetical protein J6590_001814 [Homalodisca vitripennis]